MKRNVVAWAALVVSTAALVSSRGLTQRLPAAPKVPAESQKVAHALSEAFGAVADFVKPSVVQIRVEQKAGRANAGRGGRMMPFQQGPNGPQQIDPKDLEDLFRKFFPQDGRPQKQQFGRELEGIGSGFVFDDSGHIVTNNHVVENASKIMVTFSDGVETQAKIVGTDPQTDIAVIKVDSVSYRPIPRGVSGKLKVGELVMAVGSPFSLEQSVTTGIISATDRNGLHISEYESFLQTDAAINPGNSGGPLVNMDGQVVGVNSAIVARGGGNDGVGLAIPIDLAGLIADNLIKNGKVSRARVGIVLDPLIPAMARQLGLDSKIKGVVVAEVMKGTPAEKAGLKSGDVITGFDGKPVVSRPAFRLTVASSEPGREFKLNYWRDGKEHSTTIVPALAEQVDVEVQRQRPSTPDDDDNKADTQKAEIKDFGLEVQDVTSELAGHFGLGKDSKGLLISDVKEGSPAHAAGLEPGQLITRIIKDRKIQPVSSVKEFESLAGKNDDLAFYVEITGRPGRFVTLSKEKKN